jgi:hypothetical protein
MTVNEEKRKRLLDDSTVEEIERIIRRGNKAEIKMENKNAVVVEIKRRVTVKQPTTG